jgi:hypothetical protein
MRLGSMFRLPRGWSGSCQSSYGMYCGCHLGVWIPSRLSDCILFRQWSSYLSSRWWMASYHDANSHQSMSPVVLLQSLLSLWSILDTTQTIGRGHDQVQTMARISRWTAVLCETLSRSSYYHSLRNLRRRKVSQLFLVCRNSLFGRSLECLLFLRRQSTHYQGTAQFRR